MTTGATGILAQGRVEWFKAGRGAWHGGGPGEPVTQIQLWIALPPEIELGPAERSTWTPEAILSADVVGTVRRFIYG
jgi:redox-sensitive bicupin YhaK (pirin superfamily)